MFLPRIITFLVSTALLAPLAWIFILMIRHPVPTEDELRGHEEEFRSHLDVSSDTEAISSEEEQFQATASSSDVTVFIIPLMSASGWLQFAPRRSVGYIGIAAIVILIGCIVSAAFFPKTVWSSESWEDVEESFSVDEDRL